MEECYITTQTRCLPCQRSSEDVEKICEDNKLLHLESSVSVRAVVHAGVVMHLGMKIKIRNTIINLRNKFSDDPLTWSGWVPSLSVKNTLCRCLRSFSKVLRLSSTEALVIMFLPWVANTADLTVEERNTAPGSPRHVHSTW